MAITNALLRHVRADHIFSHLDQLFSLGVPQFRNVFAVFNPSTGEKLAELPDMGVPETRMAIANASSAQAGWAKLTANARADALDRWHHLILAHSEDLASILTAEMGKPLAEARSEIAHAAAYIGWFGEEAKRVYGETIPAPSADRRMIVIKQPVGVVGAITPWNFPASMIARKIAPALAAGCAVVLKPAEQTPLMAGALVCLAEMAGLPPGVINLVYALDGAEIGREFCESTLVRKISFTGSTEVGRLLMRQCAAQIKKLSLELGGNAPMIIFDDADLPAAVEGAIQAKFRNAGQTCVAANRIFVQDGVYDAFVGRFVDRVRQLVVGDGFGSDVDIGPLIDDFACAKVEAQIADALSKGATLQCGGGKLEKGKRLFQPTVLTNIGQDMLILAEETFGPVAPIIRFSSTDAVVAAANDTIHGLAAYFYTNDLRKVWHVAEALQYGMVGINTGRMSSEAAPFGGIKQSGIGREGSRHGIDEFLEMKYLCIGGMAEGL